MSEIYYGYNEYIDIPKKEKTMLTKRRKEIAKLVGNDDYIEMDNETFLTAFKPLAKYYLSLSDNKKIKLDYNQYNRLIKLWPQIKGGGMLTSVQLDEMFSLFNNIFKRTESNKTCGSCVTNVWRQIKSLATLYSI